MKHHDDQTVRTNLKV